jgi:GT2 family glycosyltransferase
MSAAGPPVAIVLVNYKNWPEAVECLDSLLAQRYGNFHVFVVDNDSRDESIEHISAWCSAPRPQSGWRNFSGVARITAQGGAGLPIPVRITDRPDSALAPAPAGCRVTLIRSGANLGFAGGCNVGIRAAGPEAFAFYWLLNTDTVVHQDALQALVTRATIDPRPGIVGSTLRYYDRPELVQALGGSHMETASLTTRHIATGARLDSLTIDREDIERRMFYVFGASMLVARRFVEDIGPMEEDYFLYYEEIDWAMRARGRFQLAYAPDSHVFHKSGASSSKVLSSFSSNLYYRNRIKFVSRFFPGRLGTVRRGLVIELVRHTLGRRWSHMRIVAAVLWNSAKLAAEARQPGR